MMMMMDMCTAQDKQKDWSDEASEGLKTMKKPAHRPLWSTVVMIMVNDIDDNDNANDNDNNDEEEDEELWRNLLTALSWARGRAATASSCAEMEVVMSEEVVMFEMEVVMSEVFFLRCSRCSNYQGWPIFVGTAKVSCMPVSKRECYRFPNLIVSRQCHHDDNGVGGCAETTSERPISKVWVRLKQLAGV